METYQGIFLGILQGFTEFLPVSSSGHLAIGQYFFKITEPALFFDISVHMGTLIAVCVVFFQDIKSMIISFSYFLKRLILKENSKKLTKKHDSYYQNKHKNLIDKFKDFLIKQDKETKFVLMIIIASIPTVVVGLYLKQYVHMMFGTMNFVGSMLLITGTFLWMTRHVQQKDENVVELDYKKALLIGLCQGFAVVPGISRSGATIAAGLFLGIERQKAAKFSFLLSIPAILGAQVLAIKDLMTQGISINFEPIIYGTIASFIVGYISLIILLKIVKKGRLHFFAPYCWILGFIAITVGVI